MSKIVTRELLDLYDRYEGELGLLDERWASKEDRKKVSSEQAQILGEYVDKLHLLKVKNMTKELRERTENRISELEDSIEDEVALTLKERVFTS